MKALLTSGLLQILFPLLKMELELPKFLKRCYQVPKYIISSNSTEIEPLQLDSVGEINLEEINSTSTISAIVSYLNESCYEACR